jgi:colicin import membrane protein
MSENDKQANKAIIKSVLLHAGIVVMLLFSFDFSPKAQQLTVAAQNEPNIIEATFIDSNVIEQQRREKQQAEAQARAKKEQQRKQREIERKQRIEREKRKKQKALEEKAKKQKEQAAREEQQRKIREQKEAARQKEIADAKRKEEQRLEAQRQKKLAEERAAKAAAKQQFVLSETDKYIGLITQVIQRNLIFDKSPEAKECRLNIRMASSGLVFDVKILRGDPALCRAAQAAVLRPDSLPVSDDPDVYEKLRDFNLTVEL